MLIHTLLILFLSTQCLYALFTLAMWRYWRQIPVFDFSELQFSDVKLAVVIVVRNEEANLPALFGSLMQQSYPVHLWEVYLIDDFSTDTTLQMARAYQQETPFSLHVLELKDYLSDSLADGSFKKKGIEWAISQTQAELIVTTDGDCWVPELWLSHLAAFYQRTQAQMICGAVTFAQSQDTIFSRLQTVEFASLIGSGAATLQVAMPTMCNAANLAFTRRAFEQVGGYRDTASTATGDDLFLMHKIYQLYPKDVHFLKDAESTVYTKAQASLSDFYQQRRRWASKWHLYQDWRVSALAIFIFLCNFSFLLAVILAGLGYLSWPCFLGGMLLRWSTEWLFLGTVLRHLKQKKLLAWIPVTQLVYPVYVVFFGLAVQQRGYQWKGRQLNGK